MRGSKVETQGMFSAPEQGVAQDRSLRAIGNIVDRSLVEPDGHFSALFYTYIRLSILPEYLRRALLRQALYSVRSNRQLIEQLQYNVLLYSWFAGLGVDNAGWIPAAIGENRGRLQEHGTVQEFVRSILTQARAENLLSAEHPSVNGTLLEAWASKKSFQLEDREGNGLYFRGQIRSTAPLASVLYSDARLYKKAPGAVFRLAYLGRVLMDGEQVTIADCSTAEADAAVQLIDDLGVDQRITFGAGQGLRPPGLRRGSERSNSHPERCAQMIDGRTTRHASYLMSIHVSRKLESISNSSWPSLRATWCALQTGDDLTGFIRQEPIKIPQNRRKGKNYSVRALQSKSSHRSVMEKWRFSK